jgi:ATP-dependent protease Clp ATPase subunit
MEEGILEQLQLICNIIIIIGGAIMAIKNVAEWFGKPIRFFKKKTDENFEERVVEILKKVLPDMLTEHDLMIRDKYRADREAYLHEIKHEVLKSI